VGARSIVFTDSSVTPGLIPRPDAMNSARRSGSVDTYPCAPNVRTDNGEDDTAQPGKNLHKLEGAFRQVVVMSRLVTAACC
jgi:hypothetical protein